MTPSATPFNLYPLLKKSIVIAKYKIKFIPGMITSFKINDNTKLIIPIINENAIEVPFRQLRNPLGDDIFIWPKSVIVKHKLYTNKTIKFLFFLIIYYIYKLIILKIKEEYNPFLIANLAFNFGMLV